MSPEQVQQVRRVLAELIALPPEQRSAHLQSTCSGQPEIYNEVLHLLEAHDRVQSFLQTPPADTEIETARGTRIGRYVISDVLGRGSMGTVYAAMDPRIGRKIAL